MARQKLLTKTHRTKLLAHVKDQRLAGGEKDLMKARYAVLYPMVKRVIRDRFPMEDMATLDIYSCMQRSSKARLRLRVGGEVEFKTRKDDEFHIPNNGGAYWMIHLFDSAEQTEAFNAWSLARDNYYARKKVLLKAYETLIWTAKTFNELLVLWPEAAQFEAWLFPVDPDKQLVRAVSPEILAMVKTDAEQRMVYDQPEEPISAVVDINEPRKNRRS